MKAGARIGRKEGKADAELAAGPRRLQPRHASKHSGKGGLSPRQLPRTRPRELVLSSGRAGGVRLPSHGHLLRQQTSRISSLFSGPVSGRMFSGGCPVLFRCLSGAFPGAKLSPSFFVQGGARDVSVFNKENQTNSRSVADRVCRFVFLLLLMGPRSLFLAACILGLVMLLALESRADCPNNCSGNGRCNPSNSLCVCNSGWTGNDCSVHDTPLSNGVAVSGYVDRQQWNYYNFNVVSSCMVPLIIFSFIFL